MSTRRRDPLAEARALIGPHDALSVARALHREASAHAACAGAAVTVADPRKSDWNNVAEQARAAIARLALLAAIAEQEAGR